MLKVIVISIFLLSISCLGSPTEPPTKKDVELSQLWNFEHGTVGAAPPIIYDDKVIMSGGLFVYALDEETGDEIWKQQFEDDNILKGQVFLINGNQVVVAHIDKIRAWNVMTGNSEWEFDYDTNEVKPRLIGSHISFEDKYGFTSEQSKFFTLNKCGQLISIKELDKKFDVQGLLYYENKVYVAQKQSVTGALTLGRITALNGETYDSLWSYNTEKGGFINVAPIVENGVVYAGTIGNSPTDIAVALNAETGEVIWENETDYFFTRSTNLGPKYFYVNTGGSLAALNKENGKLEWRVEWMGTDFNKPVYLEGYVYHVRDSEMLIINDTTGEVVHREPVPDGTFFWHIAASSDKIFAQTSRQLIAYQPWHLRN
tara:strand:- start:22 stop:1137 length:1116 start_codon:yes stop_codon:yes gene_type:complete